ncbi:UbiA family prenyltransferase [Candidatus Woesearchaeota archaeon]|nr:UbiA family prenyltransferase [Candidatus Woesearchaeota archaeon]
MLQLFRVHQWYKNLVVALPLFFSATALDLGNIWQTAITFALFCIISSVNYILNDVHDAKKDRLNPEKKDRPIASGRVSAGIAIAIAVSLLCMGVLIGFLQQFVIAVLLLLFFLITFVYSYWAKEQPYLEFFFVSTNYIIRAVAGAYAIQVYVSPWLILGTFFLALYIIIGKRYAELALPDIEASRPVMVHYKSGHLRDFVTIATTSLLICYALYSFSSAYTYLVYTIPVFIYLVFKYSTHIYAQDSVARHPHNIIRDRNFVTALLVYAMLAVIIVY